MKTLKPIILFIGIVVGLLIVTQRSTFARDHEEKQISKNQSLKTSDFSFDQVELKAKEDKLIENYLEELQKDHFEMDKTIHIYTVEGACVYQGDKKSAKDLVRKSAFLFADGFTKYYVVIER